MNAPASSASYYSDERLAAYLQEQLPANEQATIEDALRSDENLRRRTAMVARRRDLPDHSVGSIWRTERLSCPSRATWGSYLLGTLPIEQSDYLTFHLRSVGCRYCLANLADLQSAAAHQTSADDNRRRQRFFETSAGRLKPSETTASNQSG